jgi:catechol 2,3-dioxygenase-like lactoylglutathione lyase family enzyme
MLHLAHIVLIVRDYDEALAFYVDKLGFTLVEDTYLPQQDKRWVMIRPPGAPADTTTILLARAVANHQPEYVGDQPSGRACLSLATDDFARDHAAFTAAGVEWVRPPTTYDYGKVAIFADPYGNVCELVRFSDLSPV